MNLNVTKAPVGNGVSKPVAGTSEASRFMNASLNYDGGINNGASSENLSAKFKYPRATQDVPAEGRNQYE
jgi:hypothetical protein